MAIIIGMAIYASFVSNPTSRLPSKYKCIVNLMVSNSSCIIASLSRNLKIDAQVL